jgi:hypothetical protein
MDAQPTRRVLYSAVFVLSEFSPQFCLAFVSLALAGYLSRRYRPIPAFVESVSVLLDHFRSVSASLDHHRSAFVATPILRAGLVHGHTHPTSASDRSAASTFMDALALVTGRTAYFLQMSLADQRKGRIGNRTYFWPKDVQAAASQWAPPAGSLTCIVDTDYYIDMPSFLANTTDTVILYTFQPDSAAYSGPEYDYRFDQHSVVHYRMAGGAEYTHPVWNYGRDSCSATLWFWGFPIAHSCWLIDRKSTSRDHYLVHLVCSAHWGVLTAWLARLILPDTPLRRLRTHQNGYTRLDVRTLEHSYTSTARLGQYACATVPVAVDDAIALTARLSKVGLTAPQVHSLAGDDKPASLVLACYHRELNGERPDVVYPVDCGVRRYQFGQNFDADAKPALVPFMSPFIHGAFAADITTSNEEMAIEKRVKSVQSNDQLTSFDVKLIGEFVAHLVGHLRHTAHPQDVDLVYENQARPTQRRILNEASWVHTLKPMINFFLKREAHQDVKDPRIISTMPGALKLNYARYMYTIAMHLKTAPWYAFGKPPLEIAQRVVDVCQSAQTVLLTDYSRFDGRRSPAMHAFERTFALALFAPEHHAAFAELHDAHSGNSAYGQCETYYEQHYQRASGGADTSDFNTLDNAFMAYKALRMTTVRGCYIQPDQAYAMLGVYGGDDGLSRDVDADRYIHAAATLGHKLEAVPIKRGSPGVKFLSRYYSPEVWFGRLDSCSDLHRLLSKFHVTPALPRNVTPEMKLIEKCRSAALSDHGTPIIGAYSIKVCSLSTGVHTGVEDLRELHSWSSANAEASEQYPNIVEDWAPAFFQAMRPLDHARFERWLRTAHTLQALLHPPLLAEPIEPTIPATAVTVDGEYHPGAPVPPAPKPTRRGARGKRTAATEQISDAPSN